MGAIFAADLDQDLGERRVQALMNESRIKRDVFLQSRRLAEAQQQLRETGDEADAASVVMLELGLSDLKTELVNAQAAVNSVTLTQAANRRNELVHEVDAIRDMVMRDAAPAARVDSSQIERAREAALLHISLPLPPTAAPSFASPSVPSDS